MTFCADHESNWRNAARMEEEALRRARLVLPDPHLKEGLERRPDGPTTETPAIGPSEVERPDHS